MNGSTSFAGRGAAAMPAKRLRCASGLQGARENFRGKLGEVDRTLQKLSEEWDRAVDAADDADGAAQRKLMERMNEALNRRSYVRNLVEGVEKELAEA